jgi:hypothetical protein
MRNLVMLTPYGAPGTNGLSDHVDQIVAALAGQPIPSIDKIGITRSAAEADIAHNIVMQGDSRGLEQLLDRLVKSDCTLVVHYVCYGYQRRGCPISLIRSLRSLRSSRHFRMISVFHELYASGPPWTTTFYVSPLQRFLFRSLASLSDTVVTSTPAYKRALEHGGKNAGVHPVISNIGEPPDPPELSQRANRAVVFGLPHSRRPLLESEMLGPTLKDLSVDEVLEIGDRCAQPPANIGKVQWRQCGNLSSEKVSEIFLQSRFGLLYYPRNLLSKSGVFAAYSSHRMVPVLIPRPGSPVEELRPQTHYLDSSGTWSLDNTILQGIADRSWQWYVNTRSSEVCKELYVDWCRD